MGVPPDSLEATVNIGPVLASKLRQVGIHSPAQLASIGSVDAMLRLAAGEPVVRFNMLYALEGAIRGIRWHRIARSDRKALRSALKRKERESGAEERASNGA